MNKSLLHNLKLQGTICKGIAPGRELQYRGAIVAEHCLTVLLFVASEYLCIVVGAANVCCHYLSWNLQIASLKLVL